MGLQKHGYEPPCIWFSDLTLTICLAPTANVSTSNKMVTSYSLIEVCAVNSEHS